MRILFVITRGGKLPPGGHSISAASLGKAMEALGHEIHYATNRYSVPKHLMASQSKVFHVPSSNSRRSSIRFLSGYFRRVWALLYIVAKERYDLVIAMDPNSAWHASVAACLFDIPLLPVIPGGENVKKIMPHRGVVVFSEENRRSLIQIGWPAESIILCTGRIDFSNFVVSDEGHTEDLLTKPYSSVYILYVSRLSSTKWHAFKSFVRQLEYLYLDKLGLKTLQVEVAGDGPDAKYWREYVEQLNLPFGIVVKFIGHQRIDYNLLSGYHLVVSMGRGVLEALASGTKVAISGPHGYKGRVTLANFEAFAHSNFTGRGIGKPSELLEDLSRLSDPGWGIDQVQIVKLVQDRYSSESGAQSILAWCRLQSKNLVPASGNIAKLTVLHLRKITEAILSSR